MNEIIYTSAKSMARAIQNKEISAVELVDAHLARIYEVNPALNAVVMLAAERARAEAAEAALARGESKGALHGIFHRLSLPFLFSSSLDGWSCDCPALSVLARLAISAMPSMRPLPSHAPLFAIQGAMPAHPGA